MVAFVKSPPYNAMFWIFSLLLEASYFYFHLANKETEQELKKLNN